MRRHSFRHRDTTEDSLKKIAKHLESIDSKIKAGDLAMPWSDPAFWDRYFKELESRTKL